MSTSRTLQVGGGGGMIVVTSATVAGAAATALSVSGLDLSTHGYYTVIATLANATASNSNIAMTCNADTTATNYDRQTHSYFNVTVGGGRANDAFAATLLASSFLTMFIDIALGQDGKAAVFVRCVEGLTTGLGTRTTSRLYRTAANITGITLTGSVAASLAIGSSLQVRR